MRVSSGAHRDRAVIELMDVTVSYLDQKERIAQDYFVAAGAASDLSQAQLNPRIEKDAARVRAAGATVMAIAWARAGQVAQAKTMLSKAISRAKSDAERFNDSELRMRIVEMEKLHEDAADIYREAQKLTLPATYSKQNVRAAHSSAWQVLQ